MPCSRPVCGILAYSCRMRIFHIDRLLALLLAGGLSACASVGVGIGVPVGPVGVGVSVGSDGRLGGSVGVSRGGVGVGVGGTLPRGRSAASPPPVHAPGAPEPKTD